MSAPIDSHSLPGILCDTVLSLGCVDWKPRRMGQLLTVSSMQVFMLTQQLDSHASSLAFSLPILFRHSSLSVLSCNDACTIILLHFMVISSMISILLLKNQYGYISSSTSTFVDGHNGAKCLTECLHFSSSGFAILISSAVLQSGIYVHDSTALMVMCVCLMVVSW